MANTNTVPSILPSKDYHSYISDFYLDTIDSFKENVQHPNGYFYSRSTQNSREIPGVQLGNSFTRYQYPGHLDQMNWEQWENIQDRHNLDHVYPHNVQERVSQVSSENPQNEPLPRPPPGSAPPRCDQFISLCDPRGPAPAELLSARVAAPLPLQPLSVKPTNLDHQNDYNEINEPKEESLEILDLVSILAANHGNEAEQSKSFFNVIGTQKQVRDQNTISNPDMSSNWPYDLSAALQIPCAQPSYIASSALPPFNGKTADWKSNGARIPKNFNCTACEKWFSSSGHLKRHYSTTIHKNAVRTLGQPDPAAATTTPRRHASGAAAPSAAGLRSDAARARPAHAAPLHSCTSEPYTMGSSDTLGTAVPEPKYTLYLDPKFQQHLTPNHPNASVPEVKDMSANNPPAVKPDPYSESSPESADLVEQGPFDHSADGQLPSFAQLQAQRYGTDVTNYFHRIGHQSMDYEDSITPKPVEEVVSICVPLNDYMAGEKKYWIFEPTTSPEKVKEAASPPGASALAAPHECRACGKRFSRASYLTQHNNSNHSGARPFKCARCGKRFADEAARQRHGARHAGRKPFGCDACPKSFNHKSDLRRHMCLHAAHKPFACALCGKGFVRRDHMLKHVTTHTRRGARAPSSSTSPLSSTSTPTPPSSTSTPTPPSS